jgi:Holliday junction resolvase RusA-like endonuclease
MGRQETSGVNPTDVIHLYLPISPALFRINKAYRAGRVWNSGRSVIFMGKEYSTAKALLAERLSIDFSSRFEGPIRIKLHFTFNRMIRKGSAVGLPLGDIDGPIKGIFDALADAEVFQDDAQVVQMEVTKAFAAEPGVEILVAPWAVERVI